MIAALASAFAIGQIGGPIVVRVAIGADRGLAFTLVLACAVLLVSAGALGLSARLRRRGGGDAYTRVRDVSA